MVCGAGWQGWRRGWRRPQQGGCHMPERRGPPAQTTPEANRGAAMLQALTTRRPLTRQQAQAEAYKSAAVEALAARRPLTPEQTRALTAVGVSPSEHRQHNERPWGSADDAMVRRLTRVRGWSPAAIGAFLNRPEAQVRAALVRHVPAQTASRL